MLKGGGKKQFWGSFNLIWELEVLAILKGAAPTASSL